MKTQCLFFFLAFVTSPLVQAGDTINSPHADKLGTNGCSSIQAPYGYTRGQGPYLIQQPAPLGTSVQYPYGLKVSRPQPAPYCPRVVDFTDEELLQLLATGSLQDD